MTEKVPPQTSAEQREELARLAEAMAEENGDFGFFGSRVTAVLADLAAAEAECQRLERDIRCETPDPCEGCEDEYEGDGAPGCSTCHNNCERFDAYAKTATFRMKTAEIDGRCHFEAASQLEAECQRLREERDLWQHIAEVSAEVDEARAALGVATEPQ